MALTIRAKLAIVAVTAVGGIVVWEWGLRQDAHRTAQAVAAENEAQAALGTLGPVRPLVAASVTARAVVLCDRPGSVPEAEGEWQLFGDGQWVVRRPPPLPTDPGVTEVPAFALALPVRELRSLDARARASLLDFLSIAWSDRPVAPERLLLQGIEGTLADRAALLSWLR